MKLNSYEVEKYPSHIYFIVTMKSSPIRDTLTKLEDAGEIVWLKRNDGIFIIGNRESLNIIQGYEITTLTFDEIPYIVKERFLSIIFEKYSKNIGFKKVKYRTFMVPQIEVKEQSKLAFLRVGFTYRIDCYCNRFDLVLCPTVVITENGENYNSEFAKKMCHQLIDCTALTCDAFSIYYEKLVEIIGKQVDLSYGGNEQFKLIVTTNISQENLVQLDEPEVAFGGGRNHVFPALGVKRYGPHDFNESLTSKPQTIGIAWIGTGLCKDVMQKVINGDGNYYPGFTRIYKSRINITSEHCERLDSNEINSCNCVNDIVNLLVSKAIKIRDRGVEFKVCLVELVHEWEQFFTFQNKDLHDLIKVAFWKERIPTQILTRKASDAKESLKYDNIALGLYVAAGGRPWILTKQFTSTAFIGIAFGEVIDDKKRLIGVAEVFDEFGQSISMRAMTLKTEELTYFFEDKDCHLSKELLSINIQKLVGEYISTHEGEKPNQVIIHKTTSFNDEELEAVFTQPFETRPIHIVSDSSCVWNLVKTNPPPRRGLYYKIDASVAILYTSGVLQGQQSYFLPGMPHPLLVRDLSKNCDINLTCRQIMYLTKLNWNSTNTYEREPVTVSHARKLVKLMKAGLNENEVPTDLRYFL